jgi:hypothetical protein
MNKPYTPSLGAAPDFKGLPGAENFQINPDGSTAHSIRSPGGALVTRLTGNPNLRAVELPQNSTEVQPLPTQTTTGRASKIGNIIAKVSGIFNR